MATCPNRAEQPGIGNRGGAHDRWSHAGLSETTPLRLVIMPDLSLLLTSKRRDKRLAVQKRRRTAVRNTPLFETLITCIAADATNRPARVTRPVAYTYHWSTAFARLRTFTPSHHHRHSFGLAKVDWSNSASPLGSTAPPQWPASVPADQPQQAP